MNWKLIDKVLRWFWAAVAFVVAEFLILWAVSVTTLNLHYWALMNALIGLVGLTIYAQHKNLKNKE